MLRLIVFSLFPLFLWDCGNTGSTDLPTPTRRRGSDVTAQLAGLYTVQPSLSADGQTVLYQSYADGKLYVLQRPLGQDTGTPQGVSFASDVGKVLSAQLSPDGLTFLILGATAPNLYTLYLVDVATFTPLQVVQGTYELTQFAYSPDSALFLYTQSAFGGGTQSFIGRVADPAHPAALSDVSTRVRATAIYLQDSAYQILAQVLDVTTLESAFYPLSLATAALATAEAFSQGVLALKQSTWSSPWAATYALAPATPAACMSQNSAFIWTVQSTSIQLGLNTPHTLSSAEVPLGLQTLKASMSQAEDGLGLLVDRESHVCAGQTPDQAVYGTGFVMRTQDSTSGVATKTWMFPTAQNTLTSDACLGVGKAQSVQIRSVALQAQAVRTAWRGVFTWTAGSTLQQGVVESVNGQVRIFFL